MSTQKSTDKHLEWMSTYLIMDLMQPKLMRYMNKASGKGVFDSYKLM
jgi:hypothetical protein